MGPQARRVSIAAVIALTAALFGAPGIASAAPSSPAMDPGGPGTIQWHADHTVWLESGGSIYGVRGHGYMEWDDCHGPTGMRLTVQFQRLVGGHWETTQTRHQHQSYMDEMGHDDSHGMGFTPTFHTHSGDLSHPTRMRFTFRWYDGGSLHATKMLIRVPR